MKKRDVISRRNINGKYYVVTREKGKVVERIKWSNKNSLNKYGEYTSINTNTAKQNYKQKNSIYNNRERIFRTNVIETSSTVKVDKYDDRKPLGVRRSSGKYQYRVQGDIQVNKRKITIYASSSQYPNTFPVANARSEAWTSFKEKISQQIRGQGHYDADEGLKFIENGNISNIREGVVYYAKK
jgi:hypothetical protein